MEADKSNRGTGASTQESVRLFVQMMEKEKYNRDIASIRAALRETFSAFNAYSTVANKEDEATLSGMQAMLDTFEAEVFRCGLR